MINCGCIISFYQVIEMKIKKKNPETNGVVKMMNLSGKCAFLL